MADRYKASKVGVKLLSTGKDGISPFVKPANSKFITDKVCDYLTTYSSHQNTDLIKAVIANAQEKEIFLVNENSQLRNNIKDVRREIESLLIQHGIELEADSAEFDYDDMVILLV